MAKRSDALGTKGDHLKIRYRGTMEKEDFELVKGGERASVNYMGLRTQEAPAAKQQYPIPERSRVLLYI